MKIHTIRRVQVLPPAIDAAWNFFSSPYNLCDITPPWLCFDMRSEGPRSMYSGMILQYKISAIFNIPMSWITEITHVREPEFFVDEQRFGPYRFWHHQHHFRQVDEGVEMTDIVSYAMPLGPLGDLLRTFLIGKKLEDIF